MGETQQPLWKRVHQHTHTAAGRHVLNLNSFKILEREADKRSNLCETGTDQNGSILISKIQSMFMQLPIILMKR